MAAVVYITARCVERVGERARRTVDVDRGVGEQTGVAKLAPGAGADEAPQLRLGRLATPLDLLLERVEGAEVALTVEDGERPVDTDGADQLRLQVGDAHEHGHAPCPEASIPR